MYTLKVSERKKHLIGSTWSQSNLLDHKIVHFNFFFLLKPEYSIFTYKWTPAKLKTLLSRNIGIKSISSRSVFLYFTIYWNFKSSVGGDTLMLVQCHTEQVIATRNIAKPVAEKGSIKEKFWIPQIRNSAFKGRWQSPTGVNSVCVITLTVRRERQNFAAASFSVISAHLLKFTNKYLD